ncbi:hypothetical protein HS088_TW11G00373 [Tripterygium wilfordii]|uniref:PORR domain-containing protein n=1 Tax=Tripterygium wilfordii TaxID=458696 RepID=A0A7J7D2L6_TRIWF|nr:hypothetical protein HS088_TW11G00373 [Tripterygium wilfordii]
MVLALSLRIHSTSLSSSILTVLFEVHMVIWNFCLLKQKLGEGHGALVTAFMVVSTTKLPHRLHCCRTFIAAKVKWVCDPYLDTAVSKEKDLKQAICLKNQIIFSPSKSLPLSSLSLLKSPLHLSTTASKFFQKYPFIFRQFQPSPSLPLHIKLTHLAYSLHNEELAVHKSPPQRDDAVKRLAKLLMLARATRLPLHVIDRFSFDLGLPHNYVTTLLSDYPEYFQVCEFKDCVNNEETLALELVSWREELAMSELERRMAENKDLGMRKGKRIAFPLTLPRGFDLTKKVRDWVDEWQDLPYISPYENAFHLSQPNGDQAEKWTVAVLHELLWLLVSKKTEWCNILCLGEYLGFGSRFKKALKHHPGIFYVSNKIRTQTVVLRETYKKDMLLEKHPLMGMRYRYIHLMNMMKKP